MGGAFCTTSIGCSKQSNSTTTNLSIEINDFFGEEVAGAISVYLGFLIDRIAMRYTMFNVWHTKQDTVEFIMGRQSISMSFEYPEMNPFSDFTSSAKNQISQISKYIIEESKGHFWAEFKNSSSGEISQFQAKSIDAVVTDPPYYDAIAYADLSDFFYMILKNCVSQYYPESFATPQTPKSEECTALKHHHSNNTEKANQHFENKLLSIFDVIEQQTSGLISIMFAHQSNEAWTTLCNSILGARLNITGSWAIDTEKTAGIKHGKAFLASSVTVACRPIGKEGLGDYREVVLEVKEKIKSEVSKLYDLGFRGADLLTACFGQAVSVFGKYDYVEKSNGEQVVFLSFLT